MMFMRKPFFPLWAALLAIFLSGCGVAPTRMGEGVRGAIDRTEDQRSASDQKIIFKPSNP